jgi:RNA polymerase sigma-70 factor (ECF subfamily)
VVEVAWDRPAAPAVAAPVFGRSGLDERAFDDLYAGSYRRLVGQVYAMCGNLAEAQDCVQEAFVRAWTKRRTLDAEQSPEAWVRTVASRLAISRWRRTQKALRPVDRSSAPLPPPEPNELHVALTRALQQLPAAQRRAIVLHHLCDLSVAEIALETGVPSGTVKARLSRGRAALGALLSDRLPEERTHA